MLDRSNSYLKSIIDYCNDIANIHEMFGHDYENYLNNKGYQYSVSFCVEQIGEQAKKLRELGFSEKYPEVSWDAIAGLRNRIVHGYNAIDLEMVFDISISDVPELQSQCESIMQREEKIKEDSLICLEDSVKNVGLSPGINEFWEELER